LVLVTSVPRSENGGESHIANKLEKLIDLRHACIAVLIAFVFPIEPGSERELKIV
jgi:hypothetical protein